MEEMVEDHASTIDMIIQEQRTGERNTTKMPTSTLEKVTITYTGNEGGRLPSKYFQRMTDLTPGKWNDFENYPFTLNELNGDLMGIDNLLKMGKKCSKCLVLALYDIKYLASTAL